MGFPEDIGLGHEATSNGEFNGQGTIIPVNHTVTGTCGDCGGPIIVPVYWVSSSPGESIPEWCANCGKKPKKTIAPAYGPIKEMQ